MRIDTNSFNYFNPRSREGSDTESNAGLQYDRISIHAPAKGATTASVELSDNSIISIHAPAKGATIAFQSYNSRVCISIHAPAKGATVLVYVLQIGYENFNPRSREGSDRAIDSPSMLNVNFNPRSREGSDA